MPSRPTIETDRHAGVLLREELSAKCYDTNAIVTLNCRGEIPIKIHRIVLRELCEAQRFRTCGETEPIDVSPEALTIIQEFLYTGVSKNIPYKDVLQVFIASKVLGIKTVAKQLKKYLRVKSAWKLCANQFDFESLNEADFRYLTIFLRENNGWLPRRRSSQHGIFPRQISPKPMASTETAVVMNSASLVDTTRKDDHPGGPRAVRTHTNSREVFASNPSAPATVTIGLPGSHPPPSASARNHAPLGPTAPCRRSPYPLLLLVKEAGDMISMRALTSSHQLKPFVYPSLSEPTKLPHVFDHCVIIERVLFTIHITEGKILALDLYDSSLTSIGIPRFTSPCGLTLFDGNAFLWCGCDIYEVCGGKSKYSLKFWGSSGIENMRSVRVLKKEQETLAFIANFGNPRKFRRIILPRTSDPEVSRDPLGWFIGSFGKNIYYINQGLLTGTGDKTVVHKIYEKEVFKDCLHVDDTVFLRTRVGTDVSKVTVVDMSTGIATHSFTISGDVKLVQTIVSEST